MNYCSQRCRHNKPGPKDRRIEDVFVRLLNGESIESVSNSLKEPQDVSVPPVSASAIAGSKGVQKRKKGDNRIIISCIDVETLLFGSRIDPDKVYGRKKNRASRHLGPAEGNPEEWKSVDMEDAQQASTTDDDTAEEETADPIDPSHVVDPEHKHFSGGKIRPPQIEAIVNGSVGGEKGWAERKEETAEMVEKRLAGQKRAEEKEMVRRAARRGVVFGFLDSTKGNEDSAKKGKGGKVEGDGKGKGLTEERRRKCEAVMSGKVVEASFAKGGWGIRWREDEVV